MKKGYHAIQYKASTMHMPFSQRKLKQFRLPKTTSNFKEKILIFFDKRTMQVG